MKAPDDGETITMQGGALQAPSIRSFRHRGADGTGPRHLAACGTCSTARCRRQFMASKRKDRLVRGARRAKSKDDSSTAGTAGRTRYAHKQHLVAIKRSITTPVGAVSARSTSRSPAARPICVRASGALVRGRPSRVTSPGDVDMTIFPLRTRKTSTRASSTRRRRRKRRSS